MKQETFKEYMKGTMWLLIKFFGLFFIVSLLFIINMNRVFGLGFELVMTVNMTSNVLPSPYVAAENGSVNGGLEAWRAFDGVLHGDGGSNSGDWQGVPGDWVSIDLGDSKIVSAYNLSNTGYVTDRKYDPRTWKFQGSTDNSLWNDLDSQINVSWSSYSLSKFYNFSTSTSYRYYRLLTFKSISDTSAILIGELRLYEYIGGFQSFTLKNIVNNSAINSFCMNGTGTNTPIADICTTNGTIYGNTTGTYNLTFYNITDYFNVTFQNQEIAASGNYVYNTTQAYINLSAYRLLLNTSIASFNGTNDKNQTSTTTTYAILNANNGSNNIKIDVAGNFSRNITCTVAQPLTTQRCYAFDIFDSLFTVRTKTYGGTTINNFNVTVINLSLSAGNVSYNYTTNGSIDLPLLQGYNYFLLADAPGYAFANYTKYVNTSRSYHNFTLFITNSIYMNFFDELTKIKITTTNVTAQLITVDFGGNSSYNYTTANGTIYAEIIIPSNYTIRYFADGYGQRLYSLELLDKSFQELNLTLLNENDSTAVTFKVYDNLGNVLEGAKIKILKFDVDLNSFVLNQILQTNFEGQALGYVVLNTEYYKFIIEYNGETVLTTSASYIFGTTLTFYVTLTDAVLEDYFEVYGIYGTLNYSKNNAMITFNYNDESNTATQGCVKIYTQSAQTQTLFNSSCTATPAGTIYIPLTNATSTTYYAYGIVTKGGVDNIIQTLMINNQDGVPTTGRQTGIFLLIIVEVIALFIGFWSFTIAIVLAGLFQLLFTILGLSGFNLGISISITALTIIVAYLMEK